MTACNTSITIETGSATWKLRVDDPGSPDATYDLPVLFGHDVNRYVGTIAVRVRGGQLINPVTNGVLPLAPDGPIMGWGQLDCERSYALEIGAVNAPADLVDALLAHRS